jgi:hypothetical protein
MPARSERIYLFPAEKGQPGRVMEFPVWWDRREFFNTYRQRAIDLGGPIYVDYALLLTQGEAIVWDSRCREQFSRDPRSQEPWFVSEMQQVESALNKAKWLIVESYEWESGLD